MPYSCLNKENEVDNIVESEPDDPGEVVPEIVQPHPVWDVLDSPSLV